MDMPKPTENHRKLQQLAGKWKGRNKLYPSPWFPKGGESTATVTAKTECDGFYLVSDYAETREGQVVYRGHGVFGWNPKDSCYTMHWFDIMGENGDSAPARGQWEKNTLTFEHTNPSGRHRFVYEFKGKDQYTLRIDNWTEGREWEPFVEGQYRRA